ncbi:MAG TPA: DNA recombination protein RmuC [Candidatus Syntrophosphaera sp.]|jgi:DNA recombination protein RmuC|nr:DNA recombination protein RmuC [Candidatus Syntrophosphaera sp.]OQB05279.1 MAG: RmuC family protein [Candidatus Cloacimonetes bacterium ADurb.Bin211]HOD59404.1 DNA recombination protein RmuC [Candidatus Syntrophosphaera sp.]HQM79223.1 DNA recombination protein RmuC [Candidatus Syntrophosphaera sp.]
MNIIVFLCILIAILSIVGIIILLRKNQGLSDLKESFNHQSVLIESFERNLRDDIQRLRTDLSSLQSDTRKELINILNQQNEAISKENRSNREEISSSLTKMNQQMNEDAAKNRNELSNSLRELSDSLSRRLQELVSTEQTQFDSLKTAMEGKMEQIRTSNENKLEEMRKTVDEKLQDTLEKRLSASFQQVSERLEQVYKGLGEMQNLANGVGDLKKVLSNVKIRGMQGEYQLEAILDQILSPGQYVKNWKPDKHKNEVVEFAICLPGKEDTKEKVYLPIDAKFPLADYNTLVDAWDKGDLAAVETARAALRDRILKCAKDIQKKYISPPLTTDFALLFLPIEGLYAEVLRDPNLFDELQKYHIVAVGPTTISAILNSLQLGFRTLAIQQRSNEVWKILGAIKTDFARFGDLLDKTQKKLQEASNTIEDASHRSRQIQKKLKSVEELPIEESSVILELTDEKDYEVQMQEDMDEDLT